MNKKDYLLSLLSWAEEIEDKVNNVKVESEQLLEWNEKLSDWKLFVQRISDSEEELTSERIEKYKQKIKRL